MTLPTARQARDLLLEAGRMNPGPWIAHSESSGANARRIAERCPGMDPDAACFMGLLHDIGRREGVTHLRHTLDGYRFLMGFGYHELAVICLTHSFPVASMDAFIGRVDVSDEDLAFVREFIGEHEYDEYDRLIQLCDAVSVPEGGVLIEKRLVDVVLRYGVSSAVRDKWAATLELKRRFDALAGINIYHLLPNTVQNTFEWNA